MKLLYANDKPGEHAPSWYHATCQSTSYPRLESHLETDVCIVGAGFTGLATALELRAQGIDCLLLEAHRVGWGASGRNGGQLGSGFNMDQQELEAALGRTTAHKLWDIAQQAKQWVLDTSALHAIDIGYQPGIVTGLHRKRFVKPAHAYCEHLQRHYNYDAIEALDAKAVRERVSTHDYYGGLMDNEAGHIHPLKLAVGLAHAAQAAGAHLYERSEVIRIESGNTRSTQRVVGTSGSVICQRVILATNGYVDALDKQINKRLMPINNFICVTQPLGEQATQLLPHNDAVADSRFVVNYYRRVDGDRLLFGGGENYTYRFPRHIAPKVRQAMLDLFPQLHDAGIDYAWGGTLAITRNRLPYMGELEPQRFAAGGYSGHGVALACIYGKALARHMAGDSSLYSVLSQLPDQHFPGGVRSRAALLAIAMTGYSWLDRV